MTSAACTGATSSASWAILGARFPATVGVVRGNGDARRGQGGEVVRLDMVAVAREEERERWLDMVSMAGMAMSMPC